MPDHRLPSLPADTAPLVDQYVHTCQHLGLLLEKYVPRTVLKAIFADEQVRKQDLDAAGFTWRQRIATHWNRAADQQLWQQANRRWDRLANDLGATTWTATLVDRLIIGLGSNTVLETGLTLQHTWGLPMLPGSALKGLARAWATLEDVDQREPIDQVFSSKPDATGQQNRPELVGRPSIDQVFGKEPRATPMQVGDVIFLDALPLTGAGCPQLTVDIMNPHYGDYYRECGGTPPADYLSPVPVFFLVVQGGTWRFGVAPRRPGAVLSVSRAQQWLQAALEETGAGGKTHAGYGYFRTEERKPVVGIRTTLTIRRIDTQQDIYDVEPRADAIPKIANQLHLPLEKLRSASTRWYVRVTAFKQRYTKGATTAPCTVERVDDTDGALVIWFKPAPKSDQNT